jgi:hypothetical protein
VPAVCLAGGRNGPLGLLVRNGLLGFVIEADGPIRLEDQLNRPVLCFRVREPEREAAKHRGAALQSGFPGSFPIPRPRALPAFPAATICCACRTVAGEVGHSRLRLGSLVAAGLHFLFPTLDGCSGTGRF